MSRRERILLIVSSVLVVLLVFYYYIYSPRQAEYQKLQAQLEDRQGQLARMRRSALEAPKLEAEYAELTAYIASVESKLPTSKETPALLVQLERLTKSLVINLTSIKPAALQAPGAQAAPAKAAPGQAAQPARPAVSGSYMRYPITLAMTASYAELLQLTNRFRDFPRLIVVRKLTVAPRDVPDLSATLDVETFVLPKEGP